MKRRERKRLAPAIAASALAHAALVALIWVTTSRAAPLPPMRVYAVDIVSPPPQTLGEWNPEPGATPEPVAEPEVETEAPTPEPEPTPPPPEPEPLPAPPAKKKPEPEKPKPTPPRESKPAPVKPKPAESKPAEKPAPQQAATRPSSGQRPDPSSTGGEGLDYQLKGVQCPSPAYCNNIIRQVNRYFRSPGAAAGGEADIYFVIQRDGSVSDIRLVSSTGGAAFRLAVMEAVEQAGLNQAFGALPRSFPGDDLPVSFYFRPAR